MTTSLDRHLFHKGDLITFCPCFYIDTERIGWSVSLFMCITCIILSVKVPVLVYTGTVGRHFQKGLKLLALAHVMNWDLPMSHCLTQIYMQVWMLSSSDSNPWQSSQGKRLRWFRGLWLPSTSRRCCRQFPMAACITNPVHHWAHQTGNVELAAPLGL